MTPEIQDGDRQTGSSYISGLKRDRNEIPTATPRFPGSAVSKDVSPTPTDIDRHRKFKMAAAKPEVVVTPVLQQIETKFQRLHLGFRGRPFQRTWYRHGLLSTNTWTSRWRTSNRRLLCVISANISRPTTTVSDWHQILWWQFYLLLRIQVFMVVVGLLIFALITHNNLRFKVRHLEVHVLVDKSPCRRHVRWNGRPRKPRCSRWNFVSTCCRTGVTTTSGLAAAILTFPVSVDVGRCRRQARLNGWPQKPGLDRWNLDSICYRTGVCNNFRYFARHLGICRCSMSVDDVMSWPIHFVICVSKPHPFIFHRSGAMHV